MAASLLDRKALIGRQLSEDRLRPLLPASHIRPMSISQRMRRLASRSLSLPGLLALATCLVLAACDPLVQVDATSNVPARYASVLVTVKEVWFNESATAAPADDTWQKFPLDKTRTIDLVDLTSGDIKTIAKELKVPEATYHQLRLILASRDENLFNSADDAGADHNNEVTWFDEDGDDHTRPLEVLNAAQGIGVALTLKVKKAALGNQYTSTQLLFDAHRDLTEFRYEGETGFLLNPTLVAFGEGDAGTIRGTLNLSQVSIDTGTGRPDIEITAQKLDKDLDRWMIVGSAAVSRTGAFTLYPLPLDDNEKTTEYDLVIHGPLIQTIIVRDVPVSETDPDSAAQISLNGLRAQPAESFEANLDEATPVAPRGARIGFYQTLPDENEPHLIDVAPVDPLRGKFAEALRLSRATEISYATYGPGFTLRSATPDEGEARYAVAALSPHYGSGALADTLLRPATQASDTKLFSVPAVGLPATAVPGTISATVTVATAGQYDRGMLLVTHEGAVVTAVSLDAMLQQLQPSNLVEVTQVPAGAGAATLDRGLYHLEAWTWNSTNPAATFMRHAGTAAVDLRATAIAAGTVAIP
jgi:hypothetical protein